MGKESMFERSIKGREKALEAYKRFEAQQKPKLYWRHAFNCMSEVGKDSDEDVYFITKDQRFLVRILRGQNEARCLDIKELKKLPNEEDVI